MNFILSIISIFILSSCLQWSEIKITSFRKTRKPDVVTSKKLKKLSVSLLGATPQEGNSSQDFVFDLKLPKLEVQEFTLQHFQIYETGSVSCSTPIITDGNSTLPSVSIGGCIGNGTVTIRIPVGKIIDSDGSSNDEIIFGTSINVKNIICPQGYITIHSDQNTTQDFCVMKFEAKAEDTDGAGTSLGTYVANGCDGTSFFCTGGTDNWASGNNYKATSIDDPKPWRRISRNEAEIECRELNSEITLSDINSDLLEDGTYDLISNSQWQNIAQDIELQDSNWTGLSVGSGCIFTGNNNDAAQTCGYPGVHPEGGNSTTRNSRARHNLSNGEVIFDFAGNLWEWIKNDSSFNYGTDVYINSLTPIYGNLGPLGLPKAAFGPLGDYTSHGAGTAYAGLGNGMIAGTGGAIHRGGFWYSSVDTGIFAVRLNMNASSGNSDYIGFRCVYIP